MSNGADPKSVAFSVATLFEVDLSIEEGTFTDPIGELANVRITARFHKARMEGTVYAKDLETAVKRAVVLIVVRRPLAGGGGLRPLLRSDGHVGALSAR